jgi:hypothetical protein
MQITNHRKILGLTSGYSLSLSTEATGAAYARCLIDHLFVDRLFVEDAGMWAILDICVNDERIEDVVEPPTAATGRAARAPGGEIFHGKTWPFAGSHGIELVHGHAEIPLRPIHLRKGDQILVRVRRIGSGEGIFYGCLVGTEGQPAVRSTRPITTAPKSRRAHAVTTVPDVGPNTTAQFSINITEAMDPDRLVIHNPEHWAVNDLFVYAGNKPCPSRSDSIFLQSGDVPASLFSGRPGCPPLILRRLVPGDKVTLVVTNVSESETRASITVEISGSPVADATAASAETSAQRPTSRILPMSSGVALLANTVARMTGHPNPDRLPEGAVFIPDGLIVGLDPAEARSFSLSMILIGPNLQSAAEIDNEIPASFLSGDFPSALSTLGPIRHRDPVMIQATNISGGNLPFCAGIVGRVVLI